MASSKHKSARGVSKTPDARAAFDPIYGPESDQIKANKSKKTTEKLFRQEFKRQDAERGLLPA